MPIEFSCTGCSKQLRVSDESAGKDARCPECGGINRVPFSMPAQAAVPPATRDWAFSEAGASSGNPFGAGTVNPYAAPQAASYQPDYGPAPLQPTVVSVEPILNYAWQVWKENLGLLIGITIVAGVINTAVQYALEIGQFAIIQNGGQEMVPLMAITAWFVNQAVQVFFTIGQLTIAFKLARRQSANFSDLFSGAPLFFPVFVVYLLFLAAFLVGLALLIVPGILAALALWPATYLVVDRKVGILESFSIALSVTKGNWGTGFLLGLLTFGILLVGFLALCIGLIFAVPLVLMLWATAYLMMSGQLSPYPTSQYATPQYPSYVKP